MLRKLRMRLSRPTAGIANFAGHLLYRPHAGQRADPLGIPAQYARVFYPAMYLLWALALAYQIVESYWLDVLAVPCPAPADTPIPWATNFAAFVTRFGSLAFGLTVLLIPVTIVAVNIGRELMKLAERIDKLLIPKDMREEIEAGVAAGIAAQLKDATDKAAANAAAKATAETRQQRDAEWQRWLDRRDAARASGDETFDEPRPADTCSGIQEQASCSAGYHRSTGRSPAP